MRFPHKLPPMKPKPGDTRERTFFAWLPVTALGWAGKETRWMERVCILERYSNEYCAAGDFYTGQRWVAHEFMKPEEKSP